MLLSGNVTVRRFSVDPVDSISKVDDLEINLKRNTFRLINDDKGEKEVVGWVNPFNILDFNITLVSGEISSEMYCLMSRRDKKVLPPAILKAKKKEAIKLEREKRGGRKLAKEEKQEIYDKVIDTLQRETSATTKIVDIIWIPSEGVLLVGTSGNTVDVPVQLFEETTGLYASWISPFTMANTEDMSFNEALFNYQVYGPDFLTWILTKCMGQTGEFDLPSKQKLQIDFVGDLVFVNDGAGAKTVTLSGGDSTSGPEVERFLKERRKVLKAKLSVSEDADRWNFSIDGPTFDYKGLSLPTPSVDDGADFMELRVDSMRKLFKLMDSLYRDVFLPIRSDESRWESEQASWNNLNFHASEDEASDT